MPDTQRIPPGAVIEQYGVATDGTPLHWLALLADPIKFPGKRPGIMAIHGGGFTEGNYGTPINACGADLAAEGYNVFSPEYRLAPPGKIKGQTSDGRYPDQTNDVEMALDKALADKRNNGDIQTVGGSGGGYQVNWLAAKRKISGVALSPATQLDDKKSRQADPVFASKCDNYAPTPELLAEASPLTHMTADCAPMFEVAFKIDQMPAPQYTLAVQKLSKLRVDHEATLLQGQGHSWDAWPKVKADAIAFLKSHQKSATQPEVPAPSPSPTPGKPKLKRWAAGTYALLAANHTIDKEPTLTDPEITGYRVRTGWEDVQPKMGALNFAYIDQIANVCGANGKRFGLGVSAGVASPNPETYTIGLAEKYTLRPEDVTIENQEPDMPLCFDPKFQKIWFPFIDALGARYDRNPLLAYIVVSGFMQLMENRTVITAEGLAQLEVLAKKYGFISFSAAYQDAGQKILTRFQRAFRTTQIMLTTATVAPGLKDNDILANWAKATWPGQFGTMTAGLHAVRPPYPPPPVPPLTFPKGDQPIFNSGDHDRFYKVPPVPWPPDPQPVQDLYGNALSRGDMYVELYLGDAKNPVNHDVIAAGNVGLRANAVGQPA